jgi:two-component system sensor histidine kinase FlrB
MSEETRRNIFNPFFTTKDKGVGLGLFIAHNIIKAHNGYVEAESEEGRGSSFTIYLPKGRS